MLKSSYVTMSKCNKCIFVNNDNKIHSISDNQFMDYNEEINMKDIHMICLEGIICLGDLSKPRSFTFDGIQYTI